MDTYIRFVIRHPVSVLAVILLITILLGIGMFNLAFDNSIESFLPRQDPEYLIYNQTRDRYGDNDRFMLMGISHDRLWTPEILHRIDELVTDLEEYKEINRPRESRRLARLADLGVSGSVTARELIEAFHDDPPFFRFLQRHLGPPPPAGAHLSRHELKKISEAAQHAAHLKECRLLDSVISPFTVQDIVGKDNLLETINLIPQDNAGNRIIPLTGEDIERFRERLRRNPSFENGLYSRDAATGNISDLAVMVKFADIENRDAIVREVLDIVSSYPDLSITPAGVPYVNYWFNTYIQEDLYTLVPLVLFMVVAVFYFNFRSLRGVFLPLLTLGMAECWILGLMGHLGYKLSAVGITLPPLMIAVGSSYAIHILNQYYADFEDIGKQGKLPGLTESMRHISVTVVLAGLTTAIAFFTLLTGEVSAIRVWGTFSAMGVLFTVLISVSIIPAGLKLLPHRRPRLMVRQDPSRHTTVVDRMIAWTISGSVIHYRKVLAAGILLLAFSAVGIFQLKVETEFLHYFKPEDPIRTRSEAISKRFGGGWGFSILIDSGKPDGVKTPEFLTTVETVRQWLVLEQNADLNVGRTDAFGDFIKTMHMAVNRDDPAYFTIPENRLDILDYLEIFSGEDDNSDGRPDAFEPFVDEDFQEANIMVRLCRKQGDRVGTAELKHIFRKIRQYLTATLPSNYTFYITGYPLMSVKLAHYVVSGQIQGLILSLLIVGAVVVMLFSRFKAGPLAFCDLGVAVIVNFGIMGWLGIELDTVTSIIASITIGIGVDDTIHLLNNYRLHYGYNANVDKTLVRTISVSGKAILFTSLALTVGFLVLVTSNFLPIVLFGVLTASTMINTTLGSILVIPAVIKFTGIELGDSAPRSVLLRNLDMHRLLGVKPKSR